MKVFLGDELDKCSWWKWMFDILTAPNVLFCVQIYQRKAAQLTDINCETYTVIFSYSWTMLWSTCSIENLDWNGFVEFTLEALLKLLSVPKSLQGWLKTNKRLWKHCLVCYTKIPKNTGILFSKIPVSVFEFNPGIPVFSGIPQGPGHWHWSRVWRPAPCRWTPPSRRPRPGCRRSRGRRWWRSWVMLCCAW